MRKFLNNKNNFLVPIQKAGLNENVFKLNKKDK